MKASVSASEAAAKVSSVPPGVNNTVKSRGQVSKVSVGITVNPGYWIQRFSDNVNLAPMREPNMQCGPTRSITVMHG